MRSLGGESYGVYLAVPEWQRLYSYKRGSRWPYERFGSLIAKSDRFPSIGPFVVTSDGNRLCRARIAACQSSSFRGRCRERTRYREPMRLHWQMDTDLWEIEWWWLRPMIAIMLTGLSAIFTFNISPLRHKLFLPLYIIRFTFNLMKFLNSSIIISQM